MDPFVYTVIQFLIFQATAKWANDDFKIQGWTISDTPIKKLEQPVTYKITISEKCQDISYFMVFLRILLGEYCKNLNILK